MANAPACNSYFLCGLTAFVNIGKAQVGSVVILVCFYFTDQLKINKQTDVLLELITELILSAFDLLGEQLILATQ